MDGEELCECTKGSNGPIVHELGASQVPCESTLPDDPDSCDLRAFGHS